MINYLLIQVERFIDFLSSETFFRGVATFILVAIIFNVLRTCA